MPEREGGEGRESVREKEDGGGKQRRNGLGREKDNQGYKSTLFEGSSKADRCGPLHGEYHLKVPAAAFCHGQSSYPSLVVMGSIHAC